MQIQVGFQKEKLHSNHRNENALMIFFLTTDNNKSSYIEIKENHIVIKVANTKQGNVNKGKGKTKFPYD